MTAPLHRVLESELSAAEGLAKGERTRARLLAAAAFHLEHDGFVALRVTDVTERAGISQGAFYQYFSNKTEIASGVLADFNDRGLALLRAEGPQAHGWEAILGSVRIIARIYCLNPGLMRCLWQISDETPEFGEILREGNVTWLRAISRSIIRRTGFHERDERLPMTVAYAMSAMVDQFLVQRYVTCDAQLVDLVPDEEVASEILAALWYRAVYCSDPPEGALSHASALARFRLLNT